MHAGQPMAAVQEEDRLAAAEAGTAGVEAADQKASIRNALSPSLGAEEVLYKVSLTIQKHQQSDACCMLDVQCCIAA